MLAVLLRACGGSRASQEAHEQEPDGSDCARAVCAAVAYAWLTAQIPAPTFATHAPTGCHHSLRAISILTGHEATIAKPPSAKTGWTKPFLRQSCTRHQATKTAAMSGCTDYSLLVNWMRLDPRLDPLRNRQCFADAEKRLYGEKGPAP